jgi:hypothetical protein
MDEILFSNLTAIQKSSSKLDFYTIGTKKMLFLERYWLFIHQTYFTFAKIAKVMKFEPGTLCFDVGTGGGFPEFL